MKWKLDWDRFWAGEAAYVETDEFVRGYKIGCIPGFFVGACLGIFVMGELHG